FKHPAARIAIAHAGKLYIPAGETYARHLLFYFTRGRCNAPSCRGYTAYQLTGIFAQDESGNPCLLYCQLQSSRLNKTEVMKLGEHRSQSSTFQGLFHCPENIFLIGNIHKNDALRMNVKQI